MSYGFGSRRGQPKGENRSLSAALRPAGRVALWALVGLLLIRGAEGLLGNAGESKLPASSRGDEPGPADTAFAIRFARAYLESPSPKDLDPFLAAGARIGAGRPPSAKGTEVAQTEVVQVGEVGDGREIVTVACELRDSRTLYLAVPIVRDGAGEVAALGAPSMVAVPAAAGADPERPRPIAGSGAARIRELVGKFLPAYLSAARSQELSYLLAPGAVVVPLAGSVELVSTEQVEQLGDGEGPRRELVASARVREPSGGGTYPVAYRLRAVERAGRWYVAAVEGAVA